MAATLFLEPIFEADSLACSFGFRRKRRTLGALETIRKLGATGADYVLDGDIKDYWLHRLRGTVKIGGEAKVDGLDCVKLVFTYYENIEGGHGGAADNKQRAFVQALEFTYLWQQLARP